MSKGNKRDLILDETEKLMCSMPDGQISVEMIAKNAGIGKGSIYYYFKSKDEIIDAAIERSYTAAIQEFFADVYSSSDALSKIKILFRSVLKEEFNDNRKNIIMSFHVQDNLLMHTKMMMTAVKVISPILTNLLAEGAADGSIHTDSPQESAEMIVAMLTFLLDRAFFPSDEESINRKLKLYARVLETCFKAKKDSFDYIFTLTAENN